MVRILHRMIYAAALLATSSAGHLDQAPFSRPQPSKRIAIVGMGAGGISALKAIMDLPPELRTGWEVVAFENRHAAGGLWLPDDGDVPSPPELPETPIYPSLRTNAPHPSLTLPHWPLHPDTPLLAHHEDVLRYHQGIVKHFNLSSNTRLLHNVLAAQWVGTPSAGHWELTVEDISARPSKRIRFHQRFDHLIVAPGVNRFPRVPIFPGQHEWVAAGKTLLHSIYYRTPDPYKNRTVVVVGRGPSGWDTARNLVGIAKTVYWSGGVDVEKGPLPAIPGAIEVPRIASLSGGIICLSDGSELHDVGGLILATGYEVQVPFLTAGGALHEVAPGAPQPTDRLTTNSYYIHPLYEHTLSLDTRYPLGALYFNGIVLFNPTGMCDYAQGLFAAYTIALPELLDSREQLYAALKHREELIRADGVDPAHYGHKVTKGYGPNSGHGGDGAFEDLMVNYLRDRNLKLAGRGGLPSAGVNYTEPWRVYAMEHGIDLLKAWLAGVNEGGEEWERRWSRGRRTEEDYVNLMHEVLEWWQQGGEK